MSRPRVRIPSGAKPGEVIEIRTLVDHPMETGIRTDGTSPPPRNMLARFTARMNGEPVMEVDFRNGTSPNPYLVFFVTVERTSDFDFEWVDEAGKSVTASSKVTVG